MRPEDCIWNQHHTSQNKTFVHRIIVQPLPQKNRNLLYHTKSDNCAWQSVSPFKYFDHSHIKLGQNVLEFILSQAHFDPICAWAYTISITCPFFFFLFTLKIGTSGMTSGYYKTKYICVRLTLWQISNFFFSFKKERKKSERKLGKTLCKNAGKMLLEMWKLHTLFPFLYNFLPLFFVLAMNN